MHPPVRSGNRRRDLRGLLAMHRHMDRPCRSPGFIVRYKGTYALAATQTGKRSPTLAQIRYLLRAWLGAVRSAWRYTLRPWIQLPGLSTRPGGISCNEHTKRIYDMVYGKLDMDSVRELLREKGDPTDAALRDLLSSIEIAYERYCTRVSLAKSTAAALRKLQRFQRVPYELARERFGAFLEEVMVQGQGGEVLAASESICGAEPDAGLDDLLQCSGRLMQLWQQEQHAEDSLLSSTWQMCTYAVHAYDPKNLAFASSHSLDGLCAWNQMLPRLISQYRTGSGSGDARFDALQLQYTCYTYFLALGRALQAHFRWPKRIFVVAEHV